MSGSISDYFRREILKRAFHSYTLPFTQLQIALTTRLPATNAPPGALAEPIGGGYQRSAAITLNATNFPLRTTDGLIYNAVPIAWGQDCTVSWGTITGWAAVSVHATNPQVLAVGSLATPVRFVPGQRPHLPINSIAFELED